MIKISKILLAILLTSALSACDLTVKNDGGGVVTSDSGQIQCGEICKASYSGTVTETLTATADEGFTFTGWAGACSGTDSCSVTITNSGNKSVTAQFTRNVDANELANLPFSDELSDAALIAENLVWSLGSDSLIKNVAKSGASVTIQGVGFEDNAADNTLVFETLAGFVIADPVTSNATEINVVVPDDATGVFVVVNEVRSNQINFELLGSDTPVLAQKYFLEAQAGDTITLLGEGFVAPMTASVGDSEVSVNVIDTNTLQLVVPSGVSSAALTVANETGSSNAINIRVVSSASTQMTLPSGSLLAYSDFEVIGGGLDAITPSNTGQLSIPISTTGLDFIHAGWLDNAGSPRLYLMGWSLPSSTNMELSTTSTAEALVAFSLTGLQDLDLSTIEDAMDIIVGHSAVQSLATLLETELVANPDFLSQGNAAYFQALNAAVIAVSSQIQALPAVLASKIPLQGPDITPEEQFFISAVEDTSSGGITGYINVSNSTHVFLSAQFIDSETDVEVAKHNRSYFSDTFVPPTGFFLASVKNFKPSAKGCRFIDCKIEIVTPGTSSTSTDAELAKMLAVRTAIETLVYPVISTALGSDAINPGTLMKILVSAAPAAIDTLGTGLTNDTLSPFTVAQAFWGVLLNDVTPNPEFGPITKAIYEAAGEGAAGKVAEKIALKLTPILGQLSTMFDVLGYSSSIYNFSAAQNEISNMPGDIEFDTVWPLQITGIIEGSVRYDAGPTTLILTGQGLNKISEVTLLDLGAAAPFSISLDVSSINDDHTGASILIPGDFIENAAGPVQVVAKSDIDPQSVSPDNLIIEACSPLILDRYRAIDADEGDGFTDCSVVKDNVTGLEWQRCAEGQTWNNVSLQCDGAASARYRPGHWLTEEPYNIITFLDEIPAGWRLPAVSELRTLVYCSTGSPILIDMTLDDTQCGGGSSLPTISSEAFPNTPSFGFWSSTAASNDFWWVARFDLGKVNDGGYNLAYHMRYVR